jgi:hypothetical protein
LAYLDIFTQYYFLLWFLYIKDVTGLGIWLIVVQSLPSKSLFSLSLSLSLSHLSFSPPSLKKKRKEKKVTEGWGCSSVTDILPSMHEALGSILTTAKKERKKVTEK